VVFGAITGAIIGICAGAVIGFLLYPIVGLATSDAATGLAFAFASWKVVAISGAVIGMLIGGSAKPDSAGKRERNVGEFLLRSWYATTYADWQAGRRAEALLARIEKLEPITASYSVGTMGWVPRDVSYLEWRRANPDGRGVTLEYVQDTPDGQLTTDVRWESRGEGYRSASIHVTMGRESGSASCIEGFSFCDDDHSHPREAKNSGVAVNRYAVERIKEWSVPRAHTAPTAVDAVERQRVADERYEQERREREIEAAALRKKYLL